MSFLLIIVAYIFNISFSFNHVYNLIFSIIKVGTSPPCWIFFFHT
jgi:hypothetical protein